MNFSSGMPKSPILFPSEDEDEGIRQEADVLKKFQAMLQGVPPPSSVTMSKLSASDMLNKYKENESLYSFESKDSSASYRFSQKNNSTPLVYYSNSSQTSEEIAVISQKVQSRYIYSETMSSCNIWFDTIVKTNSAKKRSGCRNGFGLSPGSRLSHLARRRQIFSCENLQQLANSDKHRHIEIKKQSALKTKTLERNKTVESDKVNSFKRALFLSPDDENSNKSNLSSNFIRRNLFSNSNKATAAQGNSTTIGVSKQMFNENQTEGSSKKRRRAESRDGSWPRRALTFTEEETDKSEETNSRSAKVISEVQLSLHHKSKLLWAVSVTLKENNISSKDPQFKTCASALFMICRKNLGKILKSKREGGTSEKMLHFAREQIGGIFKKPGVTRNGNLVHQNPDLSHTESNASCDDCFTNSQKNLENYRNMSYTNKNLNNNCSESHLTIGTREVQANITDKENIDLSESNDSFC